MIRKMAIGALAAAVCVLGEGIVLALPANLVDRGERATALVDINTIEGRASGSAFCINKDKGLFVTDGHVVIPSTGEIKVVVHSGEKDQHVATAHVLGIDYDADLAVIQVENAGQVTELAMGNSDIVVPTQEITAFGYPFGNMLSLDKDAYPSVTVNSGKVTALRKEKGDLGLIQLDALVNPGDSGGPVLDGEGRVIGIVESGVQGAGLNFATPVARLKKMLQGPLVVIEPLTIDYAQRTKQKTFSIRVSSLAHSAPDYAVDFTITDPKGVSHSVSGKTSGGKCDLLLAPTSDEAAIKWDPFKEPPPVFKFTLTLKDSDKLVATEQGALDMTSIQVAGEIPEGPGGRGRFPMDTLPDNAVETAMIGPARATEFREVNANEQLASGVHYTTGQSQGKPVIETIRLLYNRGGGGSKGQAIVAKPGYAVGGLIVDMGQFFNGFKVIFIRNKGGKLDPADTYTSDWAGDSSAAKTRQLAGNGQHVVGICGHKGTYIRAIGLVILKSDPAATQPAGN